MLLEPFVQAGKCYMPAPCAGNMDEQKFAGSKMAAGVARVAAGFLPGTWMLQLLYCFQLRVGCTHRGTQLGLVFETFLSGSILLMHGSS